MQNKNTSSHQPNDRFQFTNHTDTLEMDDDENEDLIEDADDPLDPSFLHMIDEADDFNPNGPDLYAILGVERTATAAELRAAYRRLSLLLHPDRHSRLSSSVEGEHIDTQLQPVSGDADSAFNRISTAYAILSDPNRRKIYDTYGHEGKYVCI
ncbi:unnamed protein product [Echinostoma caproni]|uniref:J domain-containing protein n=1 Tax=Echinostoma caproni TaxID=27848 RepID=A0A183B1P7_9TREM|nr:unnamed protein product [Echinostoma caproni]